MQIHKLVVAAAMAFGLASFGLPAVAHDGVAIVDPYARTTGGAGSNGAVFMVLDNHVDRDDRLIAAASDVAEKVELHTHAMSAEGMMQMLPVEDGFAVPPLGQHALARGGDHIMLIGLARDLADGDIITLTLTFEASGDVVVQVPVDNARTGAEGGHGHGDMGHGMMHQDAPPLQSADIQVQGAYALVTSDTAPNAAVFFEVTNTGATDDRLIAAETGVAARTELHTHVLSAEGLMQMLPVEDGFPVAAGATRALARGGDHVMLMGLTEPMPQGAQFALTLTFEQAGKVVVVVPVQDAPPMNHSGHGATPPANE